MNNNLLIIGCGGHARSIIDILETSTDYNISGLIGIEKELGKKVFNYSIIGKDSDLFQLRKIYSNAFIAIGQIPFAKIRIKIANLLKELKYAIPVLISKNSIVSERALIGKGTSIGHGSVVNAGSKIGENCIINSQSLIEHDCIIEDFCHVSTGALINGGTRIGRGSFIGSGAIIREGITLPPETIVKSGQRIMGWPFKENQ